MLSSPAVPALVEVRFRRYAVAAGHSRERLFTEPTADFARPVMARQPMPLKRPYQRDRATT